MAVADQREDPGVAVDSLDSVPQNSKVPISIEKQAAEERVSEERACGDSEQGAVLPSQEAQPRSRLSIIYMIVFSALAIGSDGFNNSRSLAMSSSLCRSSIQST